MAALAVKGKASKSITKATSITWTQWGLMAWSLTGAAGNWIWHSTPSSWKLPGRIIRSRTAIGASAPMMMRHLALRAYFVCVSCFVWFSLCIYLSRRSVWGRKFFLSFLLVVLLWGYLWGYLWGFLDLETIQSSILFSNMLSRTAFLFLSRLFASATFFFSLSFCFVFEFSNVLLNCNSMPVTRHLILFSAQRTDWCPFNWYRSSGDINAGSDSWYYNLQTTIRFQSWEAPVSRPGCWVSTLYEVVLLY